MADANTSTEQLVLAENTDRLWTKTLFCEMIEATLSEAG